MKVYSRGSTEKELIWQWVGFMEMHSGSCLTKKQRWYWPIKRCMYIVKKNDPPLYLPSLIFIISTSWSASRPSTVPWRWHRIFHGEKSYVQRDEVVNAGCIQRSAMILRDNGEIVLFITRTPHSWLWSERCRGSGRLPRVTTVPGELFCFDWGHCRLDSLGVLSCRLPVLNLSTQHLFTQSRAPPSQATRSLRGHLAISGDVFGCRSCGGLSAAGPRGSGQECCEYPAIRKTALHLRACLVREVCGMRLRNQAFSCYEDGGTGGGSQYQNKD